MHTWGGIKLCDGVHVTSVSYLDIGLYSMQYIWSRQLLDSREVEGSWQRFDGSMLRITLLEGEPLVI